MEKPLIEVFYNKEDGEAYATKETIRILGYENVINSPVIQMGDRKVQQIPFAVANHILQIKKTSPDQYTFRAYDYSKAEGITVLGEKRKLSATDKLLLALIGAGILILLLSYSFRLRREGRNAAVTPSKTISDNLFNPFRDIENPAYPDILRVLHIDRSDGTHETFIFEDEIKDPAESSYYCDFEKAKEIFGEGFTTVSGGDKTFHIFEKSYLPICGSAGEFVEFYGYGEDPTQSALASKRGYRVNGISFWEEITYYSKDGKSTTEKLDESLESVGATGGMGAFGEVPIPREALEEFYEIYKDDWPKEPYKVWEAFLDDWIKRHPTAAKQQRGEVRVGGRQYTYSTK